MSWESHRLIYEQHGNDDNHDEEKKRLIYTQTSCKKTRYILCKKEIPSFSENLTCIWITRTTNFYAMLFTWNTYILFVNNKNSCQNAFLFRHESQFFLMIFPWFFLTSCSFFVLLLRFATFEQRIFCHKIKKREWSWPSQQNKICFTWMTFSCFKQLAVFIYVFFCVHSLHFSFLYN